MRPSRRTDTPQPALRPLQLASRLPPPSLASRSVRPRPAPGPSLSSALKVHSRGCHRPEASQVNCHESRIPGKGALIEPSSEI